MGAFFLTEPLADLEWGWGLSPLSPAICSGSREGRGGSQCELGCLRGSCPCVGGDGKSPGKLTPGKAWWH